jgi:hypothetical protein
MLLVGAPDGFGKALRRAELVDEGPAQIVILFVPDSATLEAQFEPAKDAMAIGGGIWICWPKKTSGLQSDLSEREVRAYAMDRGLVDFKVAAIDQTWSGLRFARRKR